jgi:GntR family transcriptional regulator, transcriptional repressor for pyruvate dehydrogenase complex
MTTSPAEPAVERRLGYGPPMQSLRGRKTAERVARQIVDHVKQAGLVAGDKLPGEAELVARYGVGRASLREALRILEVDGVVEIRLGPGGGPYLAEPGAQSLGQLASLHLQFAGGTYGDLMKARGLLEATIAEHAAAAASPEALERIKRVVAMEELELGGGVADVSFAAQFHRAISEATRNRVLALYSESLAIIVRTLTARTHLRHAFDTTLVHAAIAESISRRDPEAAGQLMTDHVRRYSDEIVNRQEPGFLDEVIAWL